MENNKAAAGKRRCKRLAEFENDNIDIELQRQLHLLGPAALKGHELERRAKNKYQIGKKKILLKRNDEGKLVVKQGKKMVPLKAFLESLPEKEDNEETAGLVSQMPCVYDRIIKPSQAAEGANSILEDDKAQASMAAESE